MEVRGTTKDLGKGTKTIKATTESKALVPKKKEPTALVKPKKKKARRKKPIKQQAAAPKAPLENVRKRKKKKKTDSSSNSKALVLWDPQTEITRRDDWLKRLVKHVGGLKGVSTVGGTAVALGVGWKLGGQLVENQALRAVIPVVIGIPALAAKNKTVARIGGTAAALGLFALALEGFHRATQDEETAVATAKPKKPGPGKGTPGNGNGDSEEGGAA